MKKSYLAFFLTSVLLTSSAYSFNEDLNPPSKPTNQVNILSLSKRGGSGNRKIGLGINYMFPAPGLSAKYAITDNIKVQASAMFRSYGVAGYNYRWTMFGAEVQYCFKESDVARGKLLPFVYAGGGRGGIKYDEAFGFTDDSFSWWSYNVGGGLEWFPQFLNNNLGFSWKLGYGSIGAGSGIGEVSVKGVFMYGFGIHYYIK
ncbi:MAG: hypothetical protein ACK452_04275 [Bacteroidota bacterium]|jgi:hypothetical protein